MKLSALRNSASIVIVALTLLATGARSATDDAYGKLPLSFEPNQGQTDPQVKFLARGPGYNLFLKPTEAVLALGQGALRSRVVGGNGHAAMTGLESLPGKVNYFHGKSAHTDIPTFARVAASEVYPGIDLIHYGNQGGQLEYDFVVAPGADPKRIRLAIDGADRLAVDSTGELVISFLGKEVRWHKPVVYQTIAGERREVRGEFALLDMRTVGFKLGAYDRTQPLVIDPTLAYSTFIRSTVYDVSSTSGLAIRADAAGNTYVAGLTTSANFPTTPVAYDTTRPGGNDVFVTKLNPTGSAAVFSTYLGGSGTEIQNNRSCGIAFDKDANVWVVGSTSSTNFPTTVGAFQTTLAGADDAFVTKLNSTGSALLYSTYLGSYATDYGWAVAVDTNGNAYACGDTANNVNFPTTPGAYKTTSINLSGWVAKFAGDGSGLVYSTYLSYNDCTYARGIAADADGNAYVTGNFNDCSAGSGFETTPGAYQTNVLGGSDAFVMKFNPAGSALIYSTFLGGTGGEEGHGIAVDTAGNAYVAGLTGSTNFPVTVGAVQLSHPLTVPPNNEGFVTKLNADGSALVYSTYLGGNGGDDAIAIAVDTQGNAYVGGSTGSTNFPITAAAFQASLAGVFGSGFVTKLGPTGGLAYSSYLHGTNANTVGFAYAIAADTNGNAYVTGVAGADFPTTPGVFQGNSAFIGGAFVAKFSLADAIAPTPPAAPTKLRVLAQANTSAYLVWKDNSNNEAKFRVQRSPDGSTWTTLTNLPANTVSFFDVTTIAGTTYFYRVRAQNAYGHSAYTNIASVTPENTTSAPASASDLVATAISSTQIDLSWVDNATNECGFKITRALSPTSTFAIIATTGADITTYSDKTATPATTWYYKVRAYNPNGSAPPPPIANATTP